MDVSLWVYVPTAGSGHAAHEKIGLEQHETLPGGGQSHCQALSTLPMLFGSSAGSVFAGEPEANDSENRFNYNQQRC